MKGVESGVEMKGCLDAHHRRLRDAVAPLETGVITFRLFTVAAGTVGGQAQRFETLPANKE